MITSPSLPTTKANADPKLSTAQRVNAIDTLRALTMVLMIFVNDLWSLKNIPSWLEHVDREVDGIGLADVVFPAFLFIVGLSLPFAISNRQKKGESTGRLVVHVLVRTMALLVMGVFLVNGETLNAPAMGLPKNLWYPLCCLSFILLWNRYPETGRKYLVYAAKVIGVLTLLTLAVFYKGGEGGDQRFAPQWWGILGLIGWAYLASGLVTIFSRGRFSFVLAGWIFFCVLSMVSKAGLLANSPFLSVIPDAISGGTLTALTMGGVVTGYIFRHYRRQKNNKGLSIVLLLLTAVLIVASLLTRPYWKLSKLEATPAWLFLCSAFTMLAFLGVYWLVDVMRKNHWFNIIRPAGTNTLLCYLMPYFLYALAGVSGLSLPAFALTGGTGLLKSFLFALLCVGATKLFSKAGIQLKL